MSKRSDIRILQQAREKIIEESNVLYTPFDHLQGGPYAYRSGMTEAAYLIEGMINRITAPKAGNRNLTRSGRQKCRLNR
jgi:hypothetical protein